MSGLLRFAALAAILFGVGPGCGSSQADAEAPASVPESMDLDVDSESRGHVLADSASAPIAQDRTPAIANPALRSTGPRPIYRGHKIDIDLKDADLHNVFRLLADVGQVNIVVSDEVKGRITLRLRRVPWDQALETVVKLKRLDLAFDRGVYRVTAR